MVLKGTNNNQNNLIGYDGAVYTSGSSGGGKS